MVTMMNLAMLAALPWVVSGHGVGLPITEGMEEAMSATGAALELVKAAAEECAKELSPCLAESGWWAKSECLIKNAEKLSAECQEQVLKLARSLPSALFAESGQAQNQHVLGDIGHKTWKGCNVSADPLPYVWSYHIHLQWEPIKEKGSRATSDAWRDKFVKEFHPEMKLCSKFSFLTDLWNKASVSEADHNFMEMCEFPVYPPGGPFYHWERGFHISTVDFHRVLPWVLANRPLDGKLKIFIHPNTGCQYNDLKYWSMWAGDSVPLFTDILKGCVWAACEDKVLGCIAFNHLREDQGYGTCYTPPSELNLECTMTIEKTANATTETCRKPSRIVV